MPPWTRERRRRTRELNVTPSEGAVRTEWEKIKEKWKKWAEEVGGRSGWKKWAEEVGGRSGRKKWEY